MSLRKGACLITSCRVIDNKPFYGEVLSRFYFLLSSYCELRLSRGDALWSQFLIHFLLEVEVAFGEVLSRPSPLLKNYWEVHL